MSAQTEIRDYVIWSKHLHGDAGLIGRIDTLVPGETIQLSVDGVAGSWRKMDQGKDGRPTPGIRPLGSTQTFWKALYSARRGDLVSVELLTDQTSSRHRPSIIQPALGRTEQDRQAALEALLSYAGQGWMSDGSVFDRDAAHER